MRQRHCRSHCGRRRVAALGRTASELVAGRALAEMFLDERTRAQKSLFLAAPEGDPNRSSRLEVERLQDANGLHGDRDAGPVVGGAGAAVPRIHVSAQHDELVFQVRAGDLGDRVVGHQVVVMKLDREIDGDLDLLALLAHPDQAVIVFLGQDELGNDLGCVFVVRRNAPAAGLAGAGQRAPGHRAADTKNVPPSPCVLGSTSMATPCSARNCVFLR